MKLCKNCKHVGGKQMTHASAECRHPNNTEVSPVTGNMKLIWQFAASCRAASYACGPDGNWFEPRSEYEEGSE